MTSRHEGLLLVAALCVASFFFQTQLKIFANQIGPLLARPDVSAAGRFWMVVHEAVGWRPLLIVLLAAAMFLAWLLALVRLELSVALPLATIALVVNSIGGGLYVGEALSALRATGVVVVAVGVALVLLG